MENMESGKKNSETFSSKEFYEYRLNKVYSEKFYEFEYFNYKIRMLIYSSFIIASILFIMFGIFSYTIGYIERIFMVYLNSFLFIYILVISIFLMRRDQKRFKSYYKNYIKDMF